MLSVAYFNVMLSAIMLSVVAPAALVPRHFTDKTLLRQGIFLTDYVCLCVCCVCMIERERV